ncbi:MAG: VWA domain-containing protein [Bryobacterales bacterium]|nr:VWA domain-containing protein [Bryobacterales bacterium]
MTFGRAWVLLLVALPLAWAYWQRQRTGRRSLLALKLAALLCVVLALAEPGVRVMRTRVALAVLADTSQSVSEQDLEEASKLTAAIRRQRGRHWMRVIPFARSARQVSPAEASSGGGLRHTPGEAGEATDLEAALREALTTLPSESVPRIALISDGKENRGSVIRAAALLEQLHVPVDTFPLKGRPKPGLDVETVTLPGSVFAGERFAIDLVARSPRKADGVIELEADGKRVGAHPLRLDEGENRLRIHASISEPGAIALEGVIRAEGLNETRFNQALTLRRPRLLYVSGDPPGWEKHLLGTLRAAAFDIDVSRGPLPAQFEGFQLVVFDNWDLQALPAGRQLALEEYVKQGGGLLVIGGERNVYWDRKTTEEDPLERALPAKLAPPRSPEDRCVVLVLDKSASMSGRKIEMARASATGVIENMRPTDMLGVLTFDNSFQWAADIRRVEDGTALKKLVAGIESDGGTQIWPALAEAYSKLQPVNATYKHILLLTDGISEAGDSMKLAEQAAAERITISTVGLGRDINQPYLEKLAALANGRSYMVPDPEGLAQVVLRDVVQHTGWTTVEKSLVPVILRPVELLEGVDLEKAPPLKGYVRFIAKPTAETILRAGEEDPLLARWQYGLGRSIVFASDAKSRWAEGWVAWSGFDRFWANVARNLLPQSQPSEAAVWFDRANRELVVEYRLGRQVEAPGNLPELFALGPDNFRRAVPVQKVAGKTYRGRVAIGDHAGFFRVRPLAESRIFPELGLYRATHELRDYGSDEALLRRIAEHTGGRFNPDPREAFRSGGRRVAATIRLWPGLLGLAILLNLAEVLLRKWRGILSALGDRGKGADAG